MDKKIGFIGAGNMAKAIIGGIVKSKLISSNNIFIYSPHRNKLEKTSEELGVEIADSANQLACNVDILFMAVKPNIFIDVLKI